MSGADRVRARKLGEDEGKRRRGGKDTGRRRTSVGLTCRGHALPRLQLELEWNNFSLLELMLL